MEFKEVISLLEEVGQNEIISKLKEVSKEEQKEFVNQINELDTENVDISAFATDEYNVFRKDEIRESFDRELLLKNAPSSNGEAYSLPSME